jgi:hypothetical protein
MNLAGFLCASQLVLGESLMHTFVCLPSFLPSFLPSLSSYLCSLCLSSLSLFLLFLLLWDLLPSYSFLGYLPNNSPASRFYLQEPKLEQPLYDKSVRLTTHDIHCRKRDNHMLSLEYHLYSFQKVILNLIKPLALTSSS